MIAKHHKMRNYLLTYHLALWSLRNFKHLLHDDIIKIARHQEKCPVTQCQRILINNSMAKNLTQQKANNTKHNNNNNNNKITTMVLRAFVHDYPSEWVPKEKTFTQSYLSWSSMQPSFISFLHPLRSTAYSVFNLCALQSFSPPLSKYSLVYLLVWNPPLHTPYISLPNHCLLFTTNDHTIQSQPVFL